MSNQTPRAAILAIGNELLLGRTLNSNAFELSQRLSQLGFRVEEHRSVADDADAITAALQELSARFPLLLITGGLGPTQDDKTRQLLAQLSGNPLTEHPASAQHVRAYYAQRQLPITPRLLEQAALPQGATPLLNHHGSALGFMMFWQNCLLAVMPGVPWEMLPMFESQALPKLRELFGNPQTARQLLTCRFIGMAESALDDLAARWHQQVALADLHWGTQIRFPEVHLIFYADSPNTAAQAFPRLRRLAEQDASAALIDFDDTAAEICLHRLFCERRLTLAMAESCTGGYLASRLLALAGASNYFIGSVVAYANSAKSSMLGIAPDLLAKHGAVSRECALAMAQQTRTRHAADVGVGITGILGPGGGTYDKPIGTVFVAFCTSQAQEVELYNLKRDRQSNREELTTRVLHRLRAWLGPNTKEDRTS